MDRGQPGPQELSGQGEPFPIQVQGQYANVVQIGSSQWEFYFDFGVVEPTVSPGLKPTGIEPVGAYFRHIARIMVSTENIKGIHGILGDLIRDYEHRWGVELPDMRHCQPHPPEDLKTSEGGD